MSILINWYFANANLGMHFLLEGIAAAEEPKSYAS